MKTETKTAAKKMSKKAALAEMKSLSREDGELQNAWQKRGVAEGEVDTHRALRARICDLSLIVYGADTSPVDSLIR